MHNLQIAYQTAPNNAKFANCVPIAYQLRTNTSQVNDHQRPVIIDATNAIIVNYPPADSATPESFRMRLVVARPPLPVASHFAGFVHV
jgi:hypothetical protein